MNDENCAVNILLERARTVPKDFRGEWESMWHEDGTPRGYSMAPVGRYVHELADEVERLAAENARLRDSNKHLRNGLMQVIDTLREQGKVFAPAINEIHKHLDESQDMLSPASHKRVTDSNRQETEMTPRESDVMHHALRESVEIVDD